MANVGTGYGCFIQVIVYPFVMLWAAWEWLRDTLLTKWGGPFIALLELGLIVALFYYGITWDQIFWWYFFLFFFLTLAWVTKFVFNRNNSAIVSAFSTLCTAIFFFILLGGACFEFWGAWMPYAAFLILETLFGISVNLYLQYFEGGESWERKSQDYQFNFLEGFGGDTFSEFASGVGVLVTVGIYLVYQSGTGAYWWAGQVGALISLLAAAAWVQRYVLEKPTFPEGVDHPTVTDHLKKSAQSLVNSLAAILTVGAILVPTLENIKGLEEATGGIWFCWLIFIAWLLVAVNWLVASLEPLQKLNNSANWPTNPPRQQWSNRDKVSGYLKWIRVFVITFVVLIIFFFAWTIFGLVHMNESEPWPFFWYQWINKVLGILATLFFCVAIVLKWKYDNYEAREDQELKMLLIFKDIALFTTGLLIFFGQLIDLFRDGWLVTGVPADIYKFVLGIMAYSFLIGILIGAYKWTMRYRPHPQ